MIKIGGRKGRGYKKEEGVEKGNIWIEDDLTWKKRQNRWKMKEMARAEGVSKGEGGKSVRKK